MKTLSNGTKVICNGKQATIMTDKGYKESCGYDASNEKYEEPCGISSGTVITTSKEYYKEQERIWKDALTLEDGEVVNFSDDEGTFKVKFMGDFSDSIHFIKIK